MAAAGADVLRRIDADGPGRASPGALGVLEPGAAGPVSLTLLSPNDEFMYRLMAVAEPFARGQTVS